MKKSFLLLLLLLLFPSSALAKSPIPPLQKTEAYTRMLAYVENLESREQASEDQKKKFIARLSTQRQRADAQVLLLAERRAKRARQNYNALLQKRLGSLRQKFKSRLRKLNRAADGQRRRAGRDFRQAREAIVRRYSQRLRPLRKRVSGLRRQAAESNDPREENLLLEEINLLQRKIKRISGAQNKEVSQAKDLLRRSLRAIAASKKRKETIILEEQKREGKAIREAWSAERKRALQAVQGRRKKDTESVLRLNKRGQMAISAMRE